MKYFVLATVDAQESAQLRILNKAQLRQIEDLEQKLEDSRRKMRYLEHQFAIVKGKLTSKGYQKVFSTSKQCHSVLLTIFKL